MITHSQRLIRRCAAAVMSATLALTAFADTSLFYTHADTIAAFNNQSAENSGDINSTQGDLSELERKQKELDKKIQETEGNISSEKEHKQALNDQILVVEDTLHALAGSVTDLREAVAATEADIAAKEAEVEAKKKEIDEGIEDYKQRLRAMYVAGEQNSYTEIIVGSSDFYDMLMKLELIKRVASHDNKELDTLVELKAQYENEAEALTLQKDQLESDLAQLKQRRKQQKSQMQKLENLYTETEATLDQLAYDKEVYEANREQIDREHQQFEDELAALFAKQQALAAAKKDEQERLAKLEKEQKAALAEQKKKSKKLAEENAKKKKEQEEAQQAQAEEQAQIDNSPKEIEGDEDPFRDQQTEDPAALGDNAEDNSIDDTGDDYSDQTADNGESTYSDANTTGTPSGNGSDPNDAYGYVSKSRFTWPVPGYYHISYGVGYRWGAYHQGIDIWSEGIRGHNIIAADSGTVILVSNTCTHDYGKNGSCGCGGGYGNYCIIDQGDGWWTLYGHSEGITVSEGQWVEKGDVLGTVGSTGYSTGPHLHFEVRINNEPQDPTDYV